MTDPMARLDGEQQVLCLAARTTLTADAAADLRQAAAGGIDWDRLWRLGHVHEVVPLMAGTLAQAVPDAVPAAWLERAQRRRHVTLATNLRLSEALFGVLDGLAAAGVDAMPVKGLVVAHRLYGSLAARPSADIDVLVHPADLVTARSVLVELGFRPPSNPGFKALVHPFHDPVWVRGTGGDHVLLELHRALWADSERRMGTDGLWARSIAVDLLGHPVRVLSLEDTLLHLAIHRTRSALRLRWIVDVAELVRRAGTTLDWDAYDERATAAGARTSSWVILSLVRDLFGAPVPPEVLERFAVGWPKRVILQRTCGQAALFRSAAGDDVRQQPHLSVRAFEEDGAANIARLFGRSVMRPVRERLHDAGWRPATSRLG